MSEWNTKTENKIFRSHSLQPCCSWETAIFKFWLNFESFNGWKSEKWKQKSYLGIVSFYSSVSNTISIFTFILVSYFRIPPPPFSFHQGFHFHWESFALSEFVFFPFNFFGPKDLIFYLFADVVRCHILQPFPLFQELLLFILHLADKDGLRTYSGYPANY